MLPTHDLGDSVYEILLVMWPRPLCSTKTEMLFAITVEEFLTMIKWKAIVVVFDSLCDIVVMTSM